MSAIQVNLQLLRFKQFQKSKDFLVCLIKLELLFLKKIKNL